MLVVFYNAGHYPAILGKFCRVTRLDPGQQRVVKITDLKAWNDRLISGIPPIIRFQSTGY